MDSKHVKGKGAIAVQQTEKVQLEFSLETLERLFMNGQLCAAEFSCLNANSKKVVQALCLNTCMHRVCNERSRAAPLEEGLLIDNKNISY
ncbi:hypothetical protein K6Q96_18315 [Grimontia kaedaensis]|uniref:Uncharacterized protein n=1 Tax=Grimontia kaedaensis TaxID=2872157 RepID=A0ABY4X1P8_9GAMM|nr:hypothetical protein [Grimontia kaedaensis]USH05176.1 hypothetical protein K6Q96_18315 [Grimontia kaedaensis]